MQETEIRKQSTNKIGEDRSNWLAVNYTVDRFRKWIHLNPRSILEKETERTQIELRFQMGNHETINRYIICEL